MKIRFYASLLIVIFISACASTPEKAAVIDSEVNCDDVAVEGEVSLLGLQAELTKINQTIIDIEDIQRKESDSQNTIVGSSLSCEPGWGGDHCRGVEVKKLGVVNKKIAQAAKQLKALRVNQHVYKCLIMRYKKS